MVDGGVNADFSPGSCHHPVVVVSTGLQIGGL